MRHKKSINHLGRTAAHRKAMLSNMASSLIMRKRIETTTAKAKALKRYIEPLITRSKEDTTHSRRVVFSYLQDKEAVSELFREVASRVADRPGGYTRIIRLGNRVGDNADMCMMELVDFNENLLAEKAASRKSTGRRRRGASKKKAGETPVAATAKVEEAPKKESIETEAETAVVEEAPVIAEAEVETAEEAPVEAEVETAEEVPAEVKAEAEEEEPAAEDEPATDTKDEEKANDDKKEA